MARDEQLPTLCHEDDDERKRTADEVSDIKRHCRPIEGAANDRPGNCTDQIVGEPLH